MVHPYISLKPPQVSSWNTATMEIYIRK